MELLSLQAQVRRLREGFNELQQRTEEAELCLPIPPVEMTKEPLVMPPKLAVAYGPHHKNLWPYAVLAAIALALAPRRPAPMPQLQAGAPRVAAPASSAPGTDEAVALVRSFKPEGSGRSFGELVSKKLGSLSGRAWEVERVGEGIFLVSFHPQGAFGPESSYDFTVDLTERSVTPEPDTIDRLLAAR